jgi:phospholipid-binding lipoprotein MlaA
MLLSRVLRLGLPALLAAIVLNLSACATRPPASDSVALAAFEENNDRLEPMNRSMFKFDQGYREHVLNPFLRGYRAVVPEGGRRGILNFEHNLHSPVTFVHDILQGNFRRAGETLGRLVLNTGVGFFGFFDVADKMGIPYHAEDFGQTLAVWGVGEGSYVYVPFFGPTTIRDGIGLGVDVFLVDPLSWYESGHNNAGWVEWADLGAFYTSEQDDAMDALNELKKSSIDYYAALRSAYRQNRAKEIRNGAPPPLEDFDAPP